MLALATLLLSAVIALQIPAVQTAVVQRIIDRTVKDIDGRIEMEKVDFYPFNTLIIKNIAIIDEHPYVGGKDVPQDTLFRAETVAARFSLGGLVSKNGIKLRKAEVDNGRLALVSEPGEPYKNNLTRIFRIIPKNREKSTKEVLSIAKVTVKDFDFRLINYRKPLEARPGCIDWSDLEVFADVEGKDFRIANSIVSGKVHKAAITEKTGFTATLSGEVKAGRGLTEIDRLRLNDGLSDISLDVFTMNYTDKRAFKRFLSEVKLGATFDRSVLALETLGHFAGAFQGKPAVTEITSGRLDGYIKDLCLKDFTFTDLTGDLGGTIDASVIGLPDIRALILDCALKDVSFTTGGLSSFVSPWTGGSLDLGRFAPHETFRLDATAQGTIADLAARLSLSSTGAGAADASIRVRNLTRTQPVAINGTISTDNLNIGKFIGKDFIKECTLDTEVSATLAKGNPTAIIDTLNVSRLNILDYDYTRIRAAGSYRDNYFDGRVVCDDPGLNFLFSGRLNLSKAAENALYRFYASIGYADLHAMHLDPRPDSKMSVQSINANYIRHAGGGLSGTAEADGIILTNYLGSHDIGSIRLSSFSDGGHNELELDSSFATAFFSGSDNIGTMLKQVKDLVLGSQTGALFAAGSGSGDGGSYRVDIDLGDSSGLLSFLAPGTFVSRNTSLRLRVNEEGTLKGTLSSPQLAYNDKYIKGLNVGINNSGDAINLTLNGSEIGIGKMLRLKDNTLTVYAQDDLIGLGYNFDNGEQEGFKGDLYFTADVSESRPGEPVISARNLASGLSIRGEEWNILPAGFRYTSEGLKIDGLEISNGSQAISVDGGISKAAADTLRMNLSSVDISIVNQFTGKDLALSGLLSGKALLTSPLKEEMGLLLNLTGEETCIAGLPLGTLRIGSSWVESDDRFNLLLRNSLDGRTNINARGSIYPGTKSLEMSAALNDLNLGYASPFLESVFSRMEGRLNGTVSAQGPITDIGLSSRDLTLSDGILQVAFTNVQYALDGPLHIDRSGLHFDNMSILDTHNGHGTLAGGIDLSDFSSIRMDTRIRLDDIECLNTTAKDNPSFYGQVFGSGRMNITGPLNDLMLDIDATTTRRGHFHIPLGSTGKGASRDLLIFKEADTTAFLAEGYEVPFEPAGKKKSDLGVRLRVTATPDVEASLEIDKSMGNVLTGNGSGIISLDIRPAKDIFAINGDYTLNRGNFHFNAMGIAQKDFAILDGSSIKFNGDIMDSDLDIDARYSIKTSLASLISDTTSVTTRRLVECDLNISDRLRSPKLSFGINVPDLDPAIKSQVESALSTEDKVQKQFIALLVTNNFLPDEQSGIVNNSNILYSNISNIMANQLNNILQKLEIPVDLGLKYQESSSGNSLFDVALSTQLFNNKVVVNGNIGNRQNKGGMNDDVVGDLDIEVKLDKKGQVRLNLFSHSADDYTNYLDLTQRNGVGVAYQKEFNSLGEFFRDLFSSKEARRRRREAREAIVEKRKTIEIE